MWWTDRQQVIMHFQHSVCPIDEVATNFPKFWSNFSDIDEESEEQLLSQWFTLVNKKNALLRRQMQLNIL